MSEEGHEALIKGAKAISAICLRFATEEDTRKKIKNEFYERKNAANS